jgi:hypothetical protein
VAYPDLAPERLKGAGVDLAKLIFVLTSRRIPHPQPIGLAMSLVLVVIPILFGGGVRAKVDVLVVASSPQNIINAT